MVRVNLIPSLRHRAPRGRRLALPAGRPGGELMLGALTLILLLGSIAIFVVERRTLAEARAEIVRAEADSARLHGAVARVERMERSQTRLAERIEFLEGVVDGRFYWLRLFETLSRSLPAYAWLERVDHQDLEPGQVRISGASFASAVITDFMRELEASPELRDVRLVEVSRSRRDSVDVQQFTLVAGKDTPTIPPISPDSAAATESRPREIEPAPGTGEEEQR